MPRRKKPLRALLTFLLGVASMVGCGSFGAGNAPSTSTSQPRAPSTTQTSDPAPLSEEEQRIMDYIDQVTRDPTPMPDAARTANAQQPPDSAARVDQPPAPRSVAVEEAPPNVTSAPPPIDESAGMEATPEPDPVVVNAAALEPTRAPDAPSTNTPASPSLSPPTLLHLSANTATAPNIVEPTSAAAANEETDGVAPPASFQRVIERYFDESDGSFRGQLDRRVMQVLAGDYEAARRPLELVSVTQQATASELIETLITLREHYHLGNESAAASALLQHVGTLSDTLREAGELKLPILAICSRVASFGAYEPIEPAVFTTGRRIDFAIYLEVQNLKWRREGEQFVSQLAMVTEVFSNSGEKLLTLDDPDIRDICRRRRRDFFVARNVSLPATLAPGGYVVKVTLTDKLGEKVAQQQTPFRVAAR